MSSEEVTEPGKARQRVEARSLLCYWATAELGIRQTQLAERLRIHQPAVSNAVRRVLIWCGSGNILLKPKSNKKMYVPYPHTKSLHIVEEEVFS